MEEFALSFPHIKYSVLVLVAVNLPHHSLSSAAEHPPTGAIALPISLVATLVGPVKQLLSSAFTVIFTADAQEVWAVIDFPEVIIIRINRIF
jgi:hypothetical protein